METKKMTINMKPLTDALADIKNRGYHRFKSPSGEYGSFEVFYQNGDNPPFGQDAGWYWCAGFPGCMPDGDASGPFDTSTEAYDDAQSGEFD
jgi:hypothetical protein